MPVTRKAARRPRDRSKLPADWDPSSRRALASIANKEKETKITTKRTRRSKKKQTTKTEVTKQKGTASSTPEKWCH